jgi:hypothetical protein
MHHIFVEPGFEVVAKQYPTNGLIADDDGMLLVQLLVQEYHGPMIRTFGCVSASRGYNEGFVFWSKSTWRTRSRLVMQG